MASALRWPRCGQHRRESSNSEEGRTHMMREHRRLIVWPSVIAAGLLAAACSDQTTKVGVAPNPSFWVTPGPAKCTGGKWTGGGRIDPTNPPGPNHDAAEETSGGQPPAFDPDPFNPEGKFTFGFNIFLAVDLQTGRCFVQKGEIEVNGQDRKSTRLNSSHGYISYAVFCLKKKKKKKT